ncbi:hypothetical protein [Verrucosispora sp. WMMC514]|uniref:hypothetical protein n=1 Tax=Verrucosispora sp. WMMC514 TaxID=3015156 RepID=UPI00248CF4E7|nr:hypothetical protein [Verrucosispora sp. WMMC514]WBB94267.1 hypothetical protein O7597_15560 [Verrucosispora sp. WMMC514]
MAATGNEARTRLAQLMDERRIQLRYRWIDVAARADLNKETLRAIRYDTHDIRPLSKRGIETALSWTPGSIDKILNGGDPEPLPAPADLDAARAASADEMQAIAADPTLPRHLRDLARITLEQVEAVRAAARDARGEAV